MGHGLAASLSRWETAGVSVAPDLEALVREALREPVAALVRRLVPELVAEQLNGPADLAALVAAAAPERAEEPPPAAEATPARGETSAVLRRCGACGESKPLPEFSPQHYVCKSCRRVQERERSRRKRTAASDSGSGEPSRSADYAAGPVPGPAITRPVCSITASGVV
jgi:hypothetical protein